MITWGGEPPLGSSCLLAASVVVRVAGRGTGPLGKEARPAGALAGREGCRFCIQGNKASLCQRVRAVNSQQTRSQGGQNPVLLPLPKWGGSLLGPSRDCGTQPGAGVRALLSPFLPGCSPG